MQIPPISQGAAPHDGRVLKCATPLGKDVSEPSHFILQPIPKKAPARGGAPLPLSKSLLVTIDNLKLHADLFVQLVNANPGPAGDQLAAFAAASLELKIKVAAGRASDDERNRLFAEVVHHLRYLPNCAGMDALMKFAPYVPVAVCKEFHLRTPDGSKAGLPDLWCGDASLNALVDRIDIVLQAEDIPQAERESLIDFLVLDARFAAGSWREAEFDAAMDRIAQALQSVYAAPVDAVNVSAEVAP